MFDKLLSICKNYLLSKPIDVFSGFKSYFFVYRFFGVFPYSFSPNNELKINSLEIWFDFIAYLCMSFFLLATWGLKMETKQLLRDPFMLISLIRSVAYFSYTFLYTLKIKSNHNRNAAIFRKIKKLNNMIFLKEKNLKISFIDLTTSGIFSIILLPIVLYLFAMDAKNFKEIFNNICLIMTLGLTGSTDSYIRYLVVCMNMFLDEILIELKNLSQHFSKNKRFKIM